MPLTLLEHRDGIRVDRYEACIFERLYFYRVTVQS